MICCFRNFKIFIRFIVTFHLLIGSIIYSSLLSTVFYARSLFKAIIPLLFLLTFRVFFALFFDPLFSYNHNTQFFLILFNVFYKFHLVKFVTILSIIKDSLLRAFIFFLVLSLIFFSFQKKHSYLIIIFLHLIAILFLVICFVYILIVIDNLIAIHATLFFAVILFTFKILAFIFNKLMQEFTISIYPFVFPVI